MRHLRRRSFLSSSIFLFSLFVFGLNGAVHGHGLMVDPPARNAVCGMAEDQRPHNATKAACIEAFAEDKNGGYQFMSVLTHDVGRQGVSPLPQNVCGFNSETWDNNNNGNRTPWDLPLDWPTTDVSSGRIDITWNISWGPHFDDTEEFVYYITKPGFRYQTGVPLKWSDFESTPFCQENYDDKQPSQNPNVVSNKGATTFKTSCTLPPRNGRHVVYGEWGRNQYTFERFHGCIDVAFGGDDGGDGGGGGNQLPVANSQSVSVDENSSLGIRLSATDSDGTITSYTVTSQPSNGSLTGNGAALIYTPAVGFSGSDAFRFSVTDNDGAESAQATVSITVNKQSGGGNQAPEASFSYSASGLDINFDAGASRDPDNGPQALAYSWNFGDGNSANGQTASHSYATDGDYAVVLTVSDGQLSDVDTQTVSVNTGGGGGGDGQISCEYIISTLWDSGFVAEIRLTNRGSLPVSGWNVLWAYEDGTTITSSWNSSLTGSGSYTASSLDWNASIAPGQTVSFGIQGTHNGSTSPVKVSGDVCGDGDDGEPAGFSITSIQIDEGEVGNVVIVRSGANDTEASVHVSTQMLDMGAQPGADYFGIHEVVVFEPGQSQKEVPIYTLEDSEVETDETVRLRLFQAEGDVIATVDATLTVIDDD